METRELRPGDWPAVQVIYEQGTAGGHATFETKSPDWEIWDAAHRSDCRFVAVDDAGTVIFSENLASLAIHERAGFRFVGRRERIGQMNGHGATRSCWSGAAGWWGGEYCTRRNCASF